MDQLKKEEAEGEVKCTDLAMKGDEQWIPLGPLQRLSAIPFIFK